MAKVTIEKADTPSESIIREASRAFAVEDARGRKIGIKKLTALDRMKLFEACGPENSKNEAYLGYASLVFHVASIDGEAVARPSNKLQLEALTQRLDDDGIDAVARGVQEHFVPSDQGLDALKN